MRLSGTTCLAALILLGACAGTPDAPQTNAEPSGNQALESGSLAAFMADIFGVESPTKEELAAISEAAASHPLGSAENPVRASGPPGQRAYLSRLNCPGGGKPAFHRLGSAGLSPYGYIMDIYALKCPDGIEANTYIDMYHGGHQEAAPLPGFTIDPPSE